MGDPQCNSMGLCSSTPRCTEHLGWCVDGDVYLDLAFIRTKCGSSWDQEHCAASTKRTQMGLHNPAPTPAIIDDAPTSGNGVGAARLALALAAHELPMSSPL